MDKKSTAPTLKTICFGEILWDKFPDGKTLGGAPLNVALRLLSLGADSTIISRLGDDEMAYETTTVLSSYGIDQNLIQTDPDLKTGIVDVKLDASGSASYTIKKPVAWDQIQITESNKKLVSQSDLLIFGSLACRSETSCKTILKLLSKAKKIVFDVNFRAPHYQLKQVNELLKKADVIKMNDDELQEICQYHAYDMESPEEGLHFLHEHTGAETLCVTRGGAGALLLHQNKLYDCAGYKTEVVDTVGAGDSFLAGLLFKLYTDGEPENALQFACALGALVAGKKGANAEIKIEEIQAKIDQN